MQISKQWSVSDIVTVALVLFGILTGWFALNSEVKQLSLNFKQLSREIALVRTDLKSGLEAAAKDRELIRKEIKKESERAAQDRELIRKEMSRLADQVDRLNQNYIDHLSFHQGVAPKTPQR